MQAGDVFTGCIHRVWLAATLKRHDRDVALLHDHLFSFMASMYPNNDSLLQQDNAPCHWVQVVKNWFEEQLEVFRQIM